MISEYWSARTHRAAAVDQKSEPPAATGIWVVVTYDLFENFPNNQLRPEDIENFVEKMRSNGQLVANYPFLPIVIARLDRRQIEAYRTDPVFRCAFEQHGDPRPYLPILKALNALRNQSIYQFSMWGEHVSCGKGLPAEEFEGGLWPESPYPEFAGESKLCLKCAPAIMPVLNLSIAPSSDIAYAGNPVTIALEFISNTHLITVAAGNSGFSPVNEFAAANTLCVGASEDRSGKMFADYSSFGTWANGRGNDLVAFGGPPEESGTSYAAPRVALFGCFCQAILLQVTRLLRWTYHSQIAGVPLVGVGTLDVVRGSVGLPQRIPEHATPFVSFTPQFEEAIIALYKSKVCWNARINGRQLKSMLCSMAEPKSGGNCGKWGFGFIDEDIVLRKLADKTIKEILSSFLSKEELFKLDSRIVNAKFISMQELEQLWSFVARAAPIWIYDIEKASFQVNREAGQGERVHEILTHGQKVISAFQEVDIAKYLRLRDEWQLHSSDPKTQD